MIKGWVESSNLFLDFVKDRKNISGIIYCLSRKETEEISKFLNLNGLNTIDYQIK